jgi:hypothetical protein
MHLAPLLPWWILVVLAGVAVTAAMVAYRRPSWPAWLRVAALGVLAVMLANPVQSRRQSTPVLPTVALVLDASASMGTSDGGQSRLERARTALQTVASSLGAGWRAEWWRLDDRLAPGVATTAAGGTAFDGLARFTAAGMPAAIVLASDGGDRGAQPPDQALASAQVPVFAIGVGDRRPAANAVVRLETPSLSAFPGQQITLTAVVSASGACVGRQSELVVRDQDGGELGRVTVMLGDEQRIPVVCPSGVGAGERRWTATLATVPGEVTTADNVSVAVMRVVDHPIRVLAVSGQAYWDAGFAIRALRRDQQLQIASFTRLQHKTLRTGDDAPERVDTATLDRTDLVLLDTRADEVLDEAAVAALAAWVDHGGGVVLIGVGDGYRGPLAALDPLQRRRERIEVAKPVVTVAGRRVALAVDGIPTVTQGAVAGMRPFTDVLIGDEAHPVVVQRPYGGGRIVAVNAEGLWRWTLAEQADGEGAARFWRQLAKVVARNADRGLSADRPRYRVGDSATIGTPDVAPISVLTPAGTTVLITPDHGEARIAIDAAGLWQVSQGAERMTLVAEADVREVVDISRHDERLLRLAQATGGALVAAEQATELGARLRRRADLMQETPLSEPLVTTPWWVLVVAMLLGLEWWLRRRRHGVV